MKIYNTKNKHSFDKSILDISQKLGMKVDFNSISNNCYRVVLIKEKTSPKYQRTGFLTLKNGQKNKVNSICWHGYRDFLIELYKVYDGLRITTAQITYKNKEDFELSFKNTGTKNIGSIVEPLQYQHACLCNENKPMKEVT
jgi:hypothetical protein